MAEHVSGSVASDESPRSLSCDMQFADVFKVLGKRWNGMIIVALMERPARFSELAKAISGITDGILADRLRELMATGLVERQLADGPATAVLYRLTPVGQDLRGAFQELHAWAARNNISELCDP
ncbi:winged helix-turn-helix transcriptional regulator [Nonomuraea sp. CA-141351]|uniref:winged helix-turn-helix transcriptional regulator n=1 Tax=Nonomuraea sp. CA-141351 TaxID=3239996 RepID=UPI003D906EB8